MADPTTTPDPDDQTPGDPTSLRRRKSDHTQRRNLAVAAVVVAAVFGMAGVTIYQNERVGDLASRGDTRAECTTRVVVDLVQAANERADYTELLSSRNIDQLKAFAALVEASLRQPEPTEAEARRIVIDYRDALDAYLHIADKAAQHRKQYPWPTQSDIEACR